MGSTKYGKPTSAALHISATNEFSFSEKIGNEHFYGPEMVSATTTRNMPFGMSRQSMNGDVDEDDEDFDKVRNRYTQVLSTFKIIILIQDIMIIIRMSFIHTSIICILSTIINSNSTGKVMPLLLPTLSLYLLTTGQSTPNKYFQQ